MGWQNDLVRIVIANDITGSFWLWRRLQPAKAVADEKELQSEAEKFSTAINAEDIEQLELAPDNSSDTVHTKLQQQYADLQQQVVTYFHKHKASQDIKCGEASCRALEELIFLSDINVNMLYSHVTKYGASILQVAELQVKIDALYRSSFSEVEVEVSAQQTSYAASEESVTSKEHFPDLSEASFGLLGRQRPHVMKARIPFANLFLSIRGAWHSLWLTLVHNSWEIKMV